MSRAALCLIAMLSLASGCAGSLAQPIESDVRWAAERWPDASLAKLSEGRSLYVAKCTNCHDLHAPDELTPERWSPKVIEMAKQAHLSSDEQALVIAYLSSISARARGLASAVHAAGLATAPSETKAD